jgi:hypothetical protein
MNNLVQKWLIWNKQKKKFISGGAFQYTTDPNLARLYHNYSDALMACQNVYDEKFEIQHYPIELRMHFNTDTLIGQVRKES